MEIIHINNKKKGEFKAMDNEFVAGKITYNWINENCFEIDHTIVDENYSGKGIGKRLVVAAVEYARENNKKIKPLCPFVISLFEKIKEFEDIRCKVN